MPLTRWGHHDDATEATGRLRPGFPANGSRRPGLHLAGRAAREAIERRAEYKGVEIAAWHVDEDETGGTQDRPGLNAAVERAVAGESDGIVSWKIDRFSRFTEGGLRDLRRLEDAGARLVFVVEDIDTSGPMGKFVYTVMLAMAEYFLGSIKAGWVTAKARAVARGAHIGPTPYGYLRNGDSTLSVDPERAPVVTEAFEVCARNGLLAAIDFLRHRAPERTWTAWTARRFFTQRIYLGQVAYGDQVQAGAHEALVTRATFEAVRHQLGDGERVRRQSEDFPLSGIATCGTCGAGWAVAAVAPTAAACIGVRSDATRQRSRPPSRSRSTSSPTSGTRSSTPGCRLVVSPRMSPPRRRN